jgi:GntR family transcriptional regulator/MocR family aminotransferase
LATHQSWSRAISSHADDFLITSGAQQAFDLIAKIMISPNQTTVAIEDPGYPLALQLFQSYGAKIVLIPLDKEGMIIDKIPNNVDLIYCTPSHQFPLGMPMSINRRSALLKYARDNHCLIIEDDYDSEFRLTQRPLDALKSMDTHDLVFYVGTFSKSLLPDLRVGFIIMPKWAKTSLCGTKLLTDWHNNWLIQDALADFIQQGHLIKHLKKMRKLYSDRYSTLTQWIKQHENSKMHIINAYAGVHVSAILRDDNNAKSIASSLKEHKISILSIEDLCPSNAPMNGLIFGYGNIESSHIIQALPIISEQLNRRPIS